MKQTDGQRQQWTHASIRMHPEHFPKLTAVGLPLTRSRRRGVMQIRTDRTEVTRAQFAPIPDFQYLNAQFMTENAWILKKGLSSMEGMDVSTADADPANPDNGVSSFQDGFGLFTNGKAPRLSEDNVLHSGTEIVNPDRILSHDGGLLIRR